MLPAVAQGALAIEGRRGDALARDAAALDHAPTAARVAAERGCLARLGADCFVPLAALAELEGPVLRLRALLAAPDGSRVLRAEGEAPACDGAALGARIAERLLAGGGGALLAALREGA